MTHTILKVTKGGNQDVHSWPQQQNLEHRKSIIIYNDCVQVVNHYGQHNKISDILRVESIHPRQHLITGLWLKFVQTFNLLEYVLDNCM